MMSRDMKSLGAASVALVVLLVALSVCATKGEQLSLKEQEEQQRQVQQAQFSPKSRYIAVPNALSRFLFYNARPIERQGSSLGGALGYKRSSSALDALTGVTLGKRSGSVDLINLEPFFSRQAGVRSPGPMYEPRWTPMDFYEGDALPVA